MKLLSVELPVCGTQVFGNFYKQNFKKLSILKDIITVNINFQNVPQDKICEYINYIESLGIEVRYIISNYVKGSSLVNIREKTHHICDECPFSLILDDDIEILDDTYVYAVNNIVSMMLEDPTIGVCNIRKGKNIKEPVYFIHKGLKLPYTAGGIIVRNRKDLNLYDPKYHHMIGCLTDALLVYSRIAEGYNRLMCVVSTMLYNHYEIRKTRKSGYARHGWGKVEQQVSIHVHDLANELEKSYCDPEFKMPVETL